MVVWYFISVIVITIKHQYQSVQVERKSHTLLTHDLSGFTFLRVWSWANSRFCFSQSSSSHTPQSPIRPPSRSNLSPFHDTNKYHQQEGTPKVLFPFNRHYFTILAHGKRSDRIYAIRLAHTSTHTYTHLCTASLVDFYAQDQYTFHKESTLKIYPQTRLLPYILHNKKFVPTYTRRRTPQPPSTVSNQFRRVPLRFQIKYIASIIILQVTKV